MLISILLWIALVMCIVALILITIRFVYPELIYSIRRASVEVDTNRAFFEYDKKNPKASELFNKAQIKDIRFEVSTPDDEGLRSRIANIKKLYHLARRDEEASETPKECLIELANLLAYHGTHLKPDPEVRHPLCVDNELLELLARAIVSKEQFDDASTPVDVQSWFEHHPVSIEQILEMLSAILHTLAYRDTYLKKKDDRVATI